ncbi:MAG: hypothetical protein K9K38_11940 [Rhodoferax sp.]|nr:hypothetical protein [Rhodoferax sp.]
MFVTGKVNTFRGAKILAHALVAVDHICGRRELLFPYASFATKSTRIQAKTPSADLESEANFSDIKISQETWKKSKKATYDQPARW